MEVWDILGFETWSCQFRSFGKGYGMDACTSTLSTTTSLPRVTD
jgi:hypothetical protein